MERWMGVGPGWSQAGAERSGAAPGWIRRAGIAAAVFGVALACAGNSDKDADGYFTESALCGGPLFDCSEDDRSVGNGKLGYCDIDQDGYGDPQRTVYTCEGITCDTPPCIGVNNNLDCDDTDATITLGVPVYPDCDNDRLGDPSRSALYCTVNNDAAPETDFNGCVYVLNGDDCDDADPVSNQINEVWQDCDSDGWGDEVVGPYRVCSGAFNLDDNDAAKPCTFVSRGGDCRDGDDLVNPVTNPEGNTCPEDTARAVPSSLEMSR